MVIVYNFDDYYNREIRVLGKYCYFVSNVDSVKYNTDLLYKNYIYDKYYNDALESAAYNQVYDISDLIAYSSES